MPANNDKIKALGEEIAAVMTGNIIAVAKLLRVKASAEGDSLSVDASVIAATTLLTAYRFEGGKMSMGNVSIDIGASLPEQGESKAQ